jgi:hypothetical protein
MISDCSRRPPSLPACEKLGPETPQTSKSYTKSSSGKVSHNLRNHPKRMQEVCISCKLQIDTCGVADLSRPLEHYTSGNILKHEFNYNAVQTCDHQISDVRQVVYQNDKTILYQASLWSPDIHNQLFYNLTAHPSPSPS